MPRKRTREVYPTGEIAHLWAHQSQETARNPQGNFSFRGPYLYSYSTCIASLVKGKGGQVVALHATRGWSNTTNGHQSAGRRAISHMPSFHVAEWVLGNGHKANLTDYKARIIDAAGAAKRARDCKEYAIRALTRLIDEANRYSRTFGLATAFKAPADFDWSAENGKAAEYASNRDRKRAERREQDRARWEAQRIAAEAAEQENREKAGERLAAWLAGQSVSPHLFSRYIGDGARLRVIGNDVETTLGARVPLYHVQRALPIVMRLIDRGEAYQHNGHTIHLGHYVLDRIEKDGTVYAGCHRFSKAEILRFVGVLTTVPPAPDPRPQPVPRRL